MAPAGPCTLALLIVNVGRAPVCAPFKGKIAAGALIVTAGPMVNFSGDVNAPVVPPPWARTRQ